VKILTVPKFLDFVHNTDFDSVPVFVRSWICNPSYVGPCHHGTVCPKVVDGGTAFNKEGGCKYIESAIADSRQGVALQLGGWMRC